MSSIPLEELHARLRNRIIEHLELVSSQSSQLAYQQAAPIAHVSEELFNAWGDWVADEAAIEGFGPPVFSSQEVSAIREFDRQVKAIAANTPDPLPPIAQFVHTPGWQALAGAAERALSVFRARGLSSEQ